jgi:hypothetical protein
LKDNTKMDKSWHDATCKIEFMADVTLSDNILIWLKDQTATWTLGDLYLHGKKC